MKFLNLDKEYEYINWQKTLEPIFNNKDFINGNVVNQFEKEIAKYLKVKYTIGVSSGTDALLIAIKALNIKNPIVLTTPYTFISTIESPMRLGAKIKFCDIDNTFNIDINKAKEIIAKEHIDIFIPVHLFGLPCILDKELITLCKNKGTYIIEDAAQSLGSMIDGKKVGTLGDLGCFSFFPSKNLGCAGDGGLIATNSQKLYEKCVMIKNHGSDKKYSHRIQGGNFRLDSIQAALLMQKLPLLDSKFIEDRCNSASIYNLFFNGIYDLGIVCPEGYKKEDNEVETVHTYNQYVVKVKKNRDKLRNYLKQKGIPTAIYYPKCIPDQICYEGFNFNNNYQNAQKATKENLALPITFLNKEDIVKIINEIRNYCEEK